MIARAQWFKRAVHWFTMVWDRKTWRWLSLGVGCIGLLVLNGPARPPTSAAVDLDQVVEALWYARAEPLAAALALGFDANRALDELNTRPLHLLFAGDACQSPQRPSAAGVSDALNLLLAAGADINATDQRGNTPLMLAARRCGPGIVQRLAAAGADLNATNGRGLTAFEMTLAPARDAGLALLRAGFRLSGEKIAYYRGVYHDEPDTLALLGQAEIALTP